MGEVQRGAAQSTTHRLDDDRPLPVRKDDSSHTDEIGFGHGIADDREGFLSDQIPWRDVVRRIEVARIKLRAREESIELDRAVILEPRRRLWRCDRGRRLFVLFGFFPPGHRRTRRWFL